MHAVALMQLKLYLYDQSRNLQYGRGLLKEKSRG